MLSGWGADGGEEAGHCPGARNSLVLCRWEEGHASSRAGLGLPARHQQRWWEGREACLLSTLRSAMPQVGTVVFAGEQVLDSGEAFEAMAAQHQVPQGSEFGWTGAPLHAWLVQSATALATPEPPPAMTRLLRSVYTVDD